MNYRGSYERVPWHVALHIILHLCETIDTVCRLLSLIVVVGKIVCTKVAGIVGHILRLLVVVLDIAKVRNLTDALEWRKCDDYTQYRCNLNLRLIE